MRVFFTADCHFGHSNIIEYTNRPFKNVNHMNEEIIKRWNEQVNQEDLVYHLGDFCFKGDKIALDFEKRLNGNIVHIGGNHDYNNGVKTLITSAYMQFGGLEVLAQHQPPTTIEEIPDYTDLILCGHIHNKWKHSFIENIPIINVGVDVWDFTPVKIDNIIKYRNKLKEEV